MKIKLVVFGALLVATLSLAGCADGRRDYGGYGYPSYGYGYSPLYGYGFGGERFRGFHGERYHGGREHCSGSAVRSGSMLNIAMQTYAALSPDLQGLKHR
jgi:hypothetical protein